MELIFRYGLQRYINVSLIFRNKAVARRSNTWQDKSEQPLLGVQETIAAAHVYVKRIVPRTTEFLSV